MKNQGLMHVCTTTQEISASGQVDMPSGLACGAAIRIGIGRSLRVASCNGMVVLAFVVE